MAHVCYKANSDVCHTAAILDAAHGNVQQPAHSLVAVQMYKLAVHRAIFFAQRYVIKIARDVTATCNAHLGTHL